MDILINQKANFAGAEYGYPAGYVMTSQPQPQPQNNSINTNQNASYNQGISNLQNEINNMSTNGSSVIELS